jgi:hypothetical protein
MEMALGHVGKRETRERAVNILIAKIKEEARLWSIVGAKHVSNVMLGE